MKKFLLFTLVAMMSLTAWAAGTGDGSSQANAIEFSWENGNRHEVAGTTLWYRVDLTPLYDEENPTLALYLTNLTTHSVDVVLDATVMGTSETKNYTLAGKGNKVWSVGASMLVKANQTEVFIALNSTDAVALSARVYEATYADEACLQAVDFNWAGNTQAAGEKWYRVDLSDAKSAAHADENVVLNIKNNGAAPAHVLAQLSPDCPSTGTTDYESTIAAGATSTKVLSRAMLNMLSDSLVYIKLTSDQSVHFSAGYEVKETGINVDCAAEQAVMDSDFVVPAGTKTYKIAVADLKGKKQMPEVTIVNNGAATAHINAKVAFACGTNIDVLEKTTTLGAGQASVKEVEKNMVDGLDASIDFVYVIIETDQPLTFSARLKHVREGNACKTSVDFDWVKGHLQDADATKAVWYAIDLSEAKANQQDVTLKITNRANATATVKADIAFECPYVDLQTMTRTIAGKTTVEKVLSYSMYAMMDSDIVYVGVTTDQPIKIETTTADVTKKISDGKCAEAIAFDWVNGHRQAKLDTVWYKIGMEAMRSTLDIPVVTITNLTNAALTIDGELSLMCPDTLENTKRTVSIKANGIYEKEISRDLFRSTAADTIYIRLVGTHDFAFQVKMKVENEGANCTKAIPFNWEIGHDQAAAEDLWYAIDLTAAKAATGKNLEITFRNKSNKESSLMAALANSCPCDAPQEQSGKLAANATQTKVLEHSALETMADVVYIRLNSSEAVHFEARLVDAAPFDPIYACDPATAIAINTLYTQTEDTVWYYLDAQALYAAAQGFTPQITLTNKAAGSNNIKAEVAYHCPVMEAMATKTTTLNKNGQVVKLIEQDLFNQLGQKDTVLVRLTGKDFEFIVELVDPNTGNDCAHAIDLAAKDTCGYEQAAGETKWYRMSIKDFTAVPMTIKLDMQNTDGIAGAVTAAMYANCQSAAMENATRTLAANGTMTKEIAGDALYGLGDSVVYLQVASAQAIKICVDTIAAQAIDTIWACQQATPVAPNIWYTQTADSAWYEVNIKNLRENTVGDAVMHIVNNDAATVNMKAELTWDCPVVYEMTTNKTLALSAGEEYNKDVTRQSIDNTAKDMAWLLITKKSGNMDIKFQLEVVSPKGEDCSDPIEFDWVNGNVHPGEAFLWYSVDMDSTRVPEGKDLRLWVENLDAANNTSAVAELYGACGEKYTARTEHTFTPAGTDDAKKYKDIDRDFLVKMGWADLLINYNSGKNTKFYIEIIDEIAVDTLHEYIVDTICDGGYYMDAHTGVEHQVFSNDAASWAWNDTVVFQKGTIMCDSIYHYFIQTIDMPKATENFTLAIQQGKKIDFSAATAALKAQFAALAGDTVVAVDSISWQITTPAMTINDFVAKNVASVSLHYTLHLDPAASCFGTVVPSVANGLISADTTILTAAYRVDTLIMHDTICPGETLANDTLRNELLELVEAGEVVQYYDSLIITLREQWINPTMKAVEEVIAVEPNVAIDVTGANTILDAYFNDVDRNPLQLGASAISWQIKEGDAFVSYTNNSKTPAYEEDVELRYVITTLCGSLESASHVFTMPAAPCTPNTGDTTVVACESFTWHGIEYTTSGNYNDTLTNVGGCDSIVTLSLTINTKFVVADSATVYADQLPYNWHDFSITAASVVVDTMVAVTTGCDSIISFKLIVIPVEEHKLAVVDTVCPGTDFVGRLTTKNITALTEWNDTVYIRESANPGIDSIYTYSIYAYTRELPADVVTMTSDSIAAVCGMALDPTASTAALEEYIASESLFAPVTDIVWEMKENGAWVPFDGAAIAGGVTSVTVRYTVKTECEDIVSDDIVLTVEHHTADNDVTYDNIEAGSVAAGRVVVVSVLQLQEMGFDPKPEDVIWYQVVGEVDAIDDATGDDIEVGRGFYFTKPEGDVLTATYYARIEFITVDNTNDCDEVLRTNVVTITEASSAAPALAPSIVTPGETIMLMNINPALTTTVRVYNIEGVQVENFQVADEAEMQMKAASLSGYYMVNIENEEQKATLKYIVK